MRMLQGGGRLVNRLGASDRHVPGRSVELMTLRARCPYARARLVPAMSATQPAADGYRNDGGNRETQSCRAETTSYSLGRFPGPGSAPFPRFPGPVSVPMRPRSTLDRSSATHTPGRRGLEHGRKDRPSGELAGRLVPVSPASYPRATLVYARPAGPESVDVGSAEWVDWLTA